MTYPYVLAEQVVDYARIDAHIDERRARLEALLRQPAREFAESILHLGIPSLRASDELEWRLCRGLTVTLRFGYAQARAEIRALRRRRPSTPLLAADDSLEVPYNATRWLRGICVQHTAGFARRMNEHWERFKEEPEVRELMLDRADREAHNIALAAVGQVLNAGRSLAAQGQGEPIVLADHAVLYAMRTERLDRNTCPRCYALHGTVVQAMTPDYWRLMPPNECRGGGRCRGFYVYGDSLQDFEELPGQQQLPEVA